MRAQVLLSLFAVAVFCGCQGRVEPDWSLIDPPADEPVIDDEVVCEDAARACLPPSAVTPEVARPAVHKDPDEIRDGLIGGQPGVSSPAAPVEPYVEATCSGGELFSDIRVSPDDTELHVISVVDAGEGEEIRLFVSRQASMALVLSSFAPARWVVEVADGVRITDVVLNGNGDQQVVISASAAITELEGEQSLGAFGIGGVDEKDRLATMDLIRGAEEATGLALTSFHGCPTGTSFSLRGQGG